MANITVTRRLLAPGTTGRQFGAEQVAQLERELPDVQLLHQAVAEVDGQEVVRRLHLLPDGAGGRIKQAQLYLVIPPEDPPTGLVITCSARPDQFEALLPEFEVFMSGFSAP